MEPVNAFEQSQAACAAERPRLAVKVGDRVCCVDRDEGIRECGTVLAVTPSGGIQVRWDQSGESWTHDRSATLSLAPAWARAECEYCHGSGVAAISNGGWAKDTLIECSTCREASGPARYDVVDCRSCRATGGTESDPCDDCDGAGRVLKQVHGYYEQFAADVPAAPKGEPLPNLLAARERLLVWATELTEHLRERPAHARGSYLHADSLRDDLIVLAAALAEHQDQLDEAGSARELQADQRDEETARLHEHLADVERERDQYKAALAAEQRMREQDAAERAALHDHCQQLSAENEEIRSENGALKVEAEAMRASVDEATQSILDAGVALTEARAEAKLLAEKVFEAGAMIEKLNAELLRRMTARGVA